MRCTFIVDSREPWPHPWAVYFSDAIKLERGALETGDFALAALPDGAVVERKMVTDLLGCIGRERERFERELKRGRYVGRFVVIVEGTLADVLKEARGIHESAIIGTLAAWTRRYCPFVFASDVELAARMAEGFLCGQVREIQRAAKAIEKIAA
jgi:ERCC4-type nuclease